ncbi:hypothetical protein VP01_2401g1 [Puccinia sorghi]|uniref:Uncharacterized protein n=1 Tax=Puccinia sorghi TaxID=27349 RepID=A0A0L6V7F1_9BASI|nr:hypothetical protein VP01_2401g1 [Puccinia sorghi]
MKNKFEIHHKILNLPFSYSSRPQKVSIVLCGHLQPFLCPLWFGRFNSCPHPFWAGMDELHSPCKVLIHTRSPIIKPEKLPRIHAMSCEMKIVVGGYQLTRGLPAETYFLTPLPRFLRYVYETWGIQWMCQSPYGLNYRRLKVGWNFFDILLLDIQVKKTESSWKALELIGYLSEVVTEVPVVKQMVMMRWKHYSKRSISGPEKATFYNLEVSHKYFNSFYVPMKSCCIVITNYIMCQLIWNIINWNKFLQTADVELFLCCSNLNYNTIVHILYAYFMYLFAAQSTAIIVLIILVAQWVTVFDMQKIQGSFCCYSNLSPGVIQPIFDAQSLCRLHSDCAKTSTYANIKFFFQCEKSITGIIFHDFSILKDIQYYNYIYAGFWIIWIEFNSSMRFSLFFYPCTIHEVWSSGVVILVYSRSSNLKIELSENSHSTEQNPPEPPRSPGPLLLSHIPITHCHCLL